MDSQNKPDFFIVGAPKCGTTSLCYYLAQHPEIFISARKEPNFFNADIIHYDRDLDEYLALFSGHHHQLCGEGSVWYLYSHTAAQAIKQFNPQAKIIIALRDPVSFIESLHSEHMSCGYETIRDLPKAIAAEELREKGQLPVRNTILKQRWYCKDWYQYRKVAVFSEQIKRYLNCFKRENIHFIVFDDLQKDTPGEYRRLLQFLGVKDIEFQPDFRVQRSNQQIRHLKLYCFFAAPPSSLIRFIRRVTPKALKPIVRKVGWKIVSNAKKILTVSRTRKPTESAFREQLKQQFETETKELSTLLNRDFSPWFTSQSNP